MVALTILKKKKTNFLEVGLTLNQEIMALRMLTTVDLFHSIMCDDSA